MAEVFQHLSDIEIPDIEITEDWLVSDIKSREDCDDAYAYLMSAVAQIEYQIDMESAKPKPWDERWLAKARCALKYKKAALNIVNGKRGVFNHEDRIAFQRERDRVLLTYIRSVVPQHEFLEWIRASGIGAMASVESEAA